MLLGKGFLWLACYKASGREINKKFNFDTRYK